MRNIFLLILVSVLIGGCAIGNTHRYDLGDATLSFESDKTAAVTALDLRSYVRSGDKSPSFVGLMRGGFGIPFDVTTSSGRPLADDMTVSIVESMKKGNIRALGVTTPPDAGEAAAREMLLNADADRFVLFLIREWKTDTYVNTALILDVSLKVLQGDGSQMAEKTLRGRENLGSSLVPAEARVHAEEAFRRKLEELFNDSKVVKALSLVTPQPPPVKQNDQTNLAPVSRVPEAELVYEPVGTTSTYSCTGPHEKQHFYKNVRSEGGIMRYEGMIDGKSVWLDLDGRYTGLTLIRRRNANDGKGVRIKSINHSDFAGLEQLEPGTRFSGTVEESHNKGRITWNYYDVAVIGRTTISHELLGNIEVTTLQEKRRVVGGRYQSEMISTVAVKPRVLVRWEYKDKKGTSRCRLVSLQWGETARP